MQNLKRFLRDLFCLCFGHAWVLDSLLNRRVCARCGKVEEREVKNAN